MAWTFKYSGSFYNIAGRHIIAEILAQDYNGPILPLRIRGISISQQWDNYLSPVMGAGCEMTIVNEESDWDYYEELLICEEQEFMLRVYIEHDQLYIQNYVLFEGFLLTDIQEQQVLEWGDINLKASNYLQQLEEVDEMDCVNEAGTHSVITYIGEALQATGLLYDIYVNCTLYETQMTNERLMDELFLHKHLFYEGEEEDAQLAYMSLQTILNTILKPFNMYVYSWNRRWYVERYSDLFAPDSNYEYTYRTYKIYDIRTLTYSSTTQYNLPILTHVKQHPLNFYTFQYTDTSQVLEYSKGYKKVTVNCKDHKGHNLVNEYFGDANTFNFYDNAINPSVGVEQWAYDQNGMLDYGEDWVRFTPEPSASHKLYRGISAHVFLRGTQRGKITLNISFRRQLTDEEMNHMIGANEADWLEDIVWQYYMAKLQIYLADPGYQETLLHPQDYWYLYEESDGVYQFKRLWGWTNPATATITLTCNRNKQHHTPHRSWKYDYEGKYYYWPYELSVDLNLDSQPQMLANVGEYSWNFFNEDLVLEVRLLSCLYGYNREGPEAPHGKDIYDPVYRKIRITTEDTEDDDTDVEVKGVIDVDYIAEYTTDIDLYTQSNHSAANTMWINSARIPVNQFRPGRVLPVYAQHWLDARTGAESTVPRELTLQDHLLEDLFQFLNKPRKKLKTTIRFDYHLPPFSFIRDENITRDGVPIDMLILGYTLDVNNMLYEIEAEEFVTDDDFRLVEGEMVDLTPPADPESDSDEEPSSGEEESYEGLYYTDYTSQQILEQGVYPGYVNFPTDITEWWVRYYNHFTLQYRNVQVGVGGVPAGKYIHILDTTILPALGGDVNTFIIVNEGRAYNGCSYHVLDGSAMEEQVAEYFVTSIGHVFKIHWAGYAWVEYLYGQSDGNNTHWTDYSYGVHISHVSVVGE